MKTTTTTYYVCLDCPEAGVYEQANSGGAAEKHTEAARHTTTTSLRPIPDDLGGKS